MMKKPLVIAEIGCNHKGEMNIAFEMIKVAAYVCKVDGVKFQKRNPKELLSEEEYHAPHPNPLNSYGKTYGEHREYLELSLEQHRQLKSWCEDFNIIYSTSVWDLTSAKEITSLKPKMIKIPSACNFKFNMLEFLCENFDGEIHLSLGMTTKKEEKQIMSYFESFNRNKDLVIYACTSGYPVAYEDICLKEILRLSEEYADRVKAIGFSGHHIGIAPDIVAFTLGAKWIERHFTLDKTWKGTDHKASLEPLEMRQLAYDVNNVSLAFEYKKQDILEVEKVQREKLKRFS